MGRSWPQGKRNRCIFADPESDGSSRPAATLCREGDCAPALGGGECCFCATSARFCREERGRVSRWPYSDQGETVDGFGTKRRVNRQKRHNPHQPPAARRESGLRRVPGAGVVMMTTHQHAAWVLAGRRTLPQYKNGGRLARIRPQGDTIGTPGAPSRLPVGRQFAYLMRTERDRTMKTLCDLLVLGAAAWVAYWTYFEAML